MIQTFKIINCLDNVDPTDYFQFATDHHNHATRQAASFEVNENDENVPVHSSNLIKPKGTKPFIPTSSRTVSSIDGIV